MKEKPILFSSSMVRAILEDRKTQTRRVIRVMQPQPAMVGPLMRWIKRGVDIAVESGDRPGIWCPYGVPGDHLWCRESFWHQRVMVEQYYPGTYQFGEFVPDYPEMQYADPWMFEEREGGDPFVEGLGEDIGCHVKYVATDDDPTRDGDDRATWWKRPSIHMPRWASRITLEVTDVRVQRVQEITEDDAIAEGIKELEVDDVPGGPLCTGFYHRDEFRSLWDSINAKKHPWDSNPYVWAITFKRIKP